MKRMTRQQYDEDLAELLKLGQVKAILVGTQVWLIMPWNIKPYMHVLSTEEALKRLHINPQPAHRSLLRRLWEWIRD